MLTRSIKLQVHTLLDAYRKERMFRQPIQFVSSESDENTPKEPKESRKERRTRNAWTTRRTLLLGETRRIVQLRFGQVDSLIPAGISYGMISKQLYIKLTTVASVCHRYLERGGTIRAPGEHWSRGRKALTQTQFDWVTSHEVIRS